MGIEWIATILTIHPQPTHCLTTFRALTDQIAPALPEIMLMQLKITSKLPLEEVLVVAGNGLAFIFCRFPIEGTIHLQYGLLYLFT